MKHRLDENTDGINIEVSEIEGKEEKLLEAFEECRQGRCSCPTEQYTKLESMQVGQIAGKINLQLKARKGTTLDQAEIEKCLEHTETRIDLEK
ncbi:hypothetical protein [Salinispira pacifica]